MQSAEDDNEEVRRTGCVLGRAVWAPPLDTLQRPRRNAPSVGATASAQRDCGNTRLEGNPAARSRGAPPKVLFRLVPVWLPRERPAQYKTW